MPVCCRSCGSFNPPGAKFCGDCGAGLGTAAAQMRPASRQEPVPPSPTSSAERRPLTVMFCDLIGSTALAARLDPEDLREIIGAYHRRVAETVARYDGYVAKYMGDGVLVYFGYPRAHEDDAERAVRAGLALVDTVGQFERLAREGSLLAVFEDTHWIDPTSRELLEMTVEHVPRLPVLLVVTFRREFQPTWTGQPYVTMLALNRLDRREGTALVERIAGEKRLPSSIVDQIVERAEGVPLFIEELTKTVLEAAELRAGPAVEPPAKR